MRNHRLRHSKKSSSAGLIAIAMFAASVVTAAPGIGAVDGTDAAVTIIGNPPLAAPPDGEGLPANITTLNDVAGIAVHPWTSQIYWVDNNDHRVRRLDDDGLTWTVAGDGTAGFGGDGGDAAEARFNSPRGISFDGDGNLYIADSGNHRIRRIDTLGFISTVAGGGAETVGIGGAFLAVDANLSYPSDVDVSEGGEFFIVADSGNHQVHRVNVGGALFTLAGSTQGFSGDSGQADEAQLSFPEAVALSDDESLLYISDLGNRRLRVYQDGIIITAAGDGTLPMTEGALASETGIGSIRDIALDAGRNIYLTDHTTDSVRRVGIDGRVTTVSGLGSGVAGSATFQQYVNPTAVAVDQFGRLLVGDEDSIVRIGTDDVMLPVNRSNPYGRPAEDQVRRLYRAAFGRVPDAGGLRFWVERYQSDETMVSLAANFIASGESIAIYGDDPSDEDFLSVIYNNVLGRGPDSGGLAFWLEQLDDGRSRPSVLVAFADSAENIERSRTSLPMTDAGMEVLRLYRAAFGRVPDGEGLEFWLARRNGGDTLATLAAAFITSPEASGYLDNPEDTLFIEALYGNVLGRNADGPGSLFWEGELRSGMSRADVLVAFSESPENRQRTGTA